MNWPKITKDTPLDEIKRIHQQIWQYVVDHGEKPHTPYACDCVACEYDDLFYIDGIEPCSHCPINWYPFEKCISRGAPYDKWTETNSEKSAIAIRDMLFKYESNKE